MLSLSRAGYKSLAGAYLDRLTWPPGGVSAEEPRVRKLSPSRPGESSPSRDPTDAKGLTDYSNLIQAPKQAPANEQTQQPS